MVRSPAREEQDDAVLGLAEAAGRLGRPRTSLQQERQTQAAQREPADPQKLAPIQSVAKRRLSVPRDGSSCSLPFPNALHHDASLPCPVGRLLTTDILTSATSLPSLSPEDFLASQTIAHHTPDVRSFSSTCLTFCGSRRAAASVTTSLVMSRLRPDAPCVSVIGRCERFAGRARAVGGRVRMPWPARSWNTFRPRRCLEGQDQSS